MNETPGRVEKFNQAVRGMVTLGLIGTLCYGFVADKISAEAFVGVVGMVTTFWFSTRGGQNPPGPSQPPSPAPTNGGTDAPKP